MNICKRAIIIALRHPLYLAIYIGFLSAMGVLLMGEVGTAQAPVPSSASSQAAIVLVDRDGSPISRALRAALETTDELVDVDDEPTALQDVLAKDQADIVLIIPEGFGDQLIDAAHAGRDLPQLNMAAGSNMQAAALASQRAIRWASLAAAQAALEPALDADSIVGAVAQSSSVEPSVQVLETTPGNAAASRLAF